MELVYSDGVMMKQLLDHCSIGLDGVLGALGLRDATQARVVTIEQADDRIKSAFAWLSSRGMALLSSDASGQHIKLVSQNVCQLQVSENNARVWVNAPDGSCIGRYNARGLVDVHRSATAQMAGGSECLDCSHEGDERSQWNLFVEAMLRHYRFDVVSALKDLQT
jgi:hypothetical protein